MTPETFQNGMAMMAEMWPEKAPSVKASEIYWMVLRELHDSVFEAAVAGCLRTCTFYPKPAEIIAKAREVLNDSQQLPPEGDVAWAQAIAAQSDWLEGSGWLVPVAGHDGLRLAGGPCPLPPLVEQAVMAVGGMDRIGLAEHKDLGFIRQEFMAFYGHKREQEIRHMPELLSQPIQRPAELSEPQAQPAQTAAA